MRSLLNTTNIPTAEQLMEGLTRRLHQASKNIDTRKLETGEYAMYGEKVVPSAILDEKLSEAAEADAVEAVLDTLPFISDGIHSVNWQRLLPRSFLPVRSVVPDIPGMRLVSRKSVTAGLVEALSRHPIQVKAAVPISGSHAMPKDGQLFFYDAKSKRLCPVGDAVLARPYQKRPRITKQRLVTGGISSKTK